MTVSDDDRLRITYRLATGRQADPHALAQDIALEQSVELPATCLRTAESRSLVGDVEDVHTLEKGVASAVISFPAALLGNDLLQALNVIFGNISLKRGILVTSVEWPSSLLDHVLGPQVGNDGLRRRCGAEAGRPLVCAALKPVGLSATDLSERCFSLAMGGIDIVKDDHGLTDQEAAPFRERVERCQTAVERANRLTGGNSMYVPNVTARPGVIEERVGLAESMGCRGALVSPLVVGLGTVQRIAAQSDLALLAHPALAGGYFGNTHGINPDVLLGTVFRLAGSDGVIYPNVGGRFVLTLEQCLTINARLRAPLGAIRPAFPVPGGGIDTERVPEWIRRYGSETVLLIGASLYEKPSLRKAAEDLVRAVKRTADLSKEAPTSG